MAAAIHFDGIQDSDYRMGSAPQRSAPNGGHTRGSLEDRDESLTCLARGRKRGLPPGWYPSTCLACYASCYARGSTQPRYDHGEFTPPLGVGRASLMQLVIINTYNSIYLQ